MARTNKIGILKKKLQLQKQKSLKNEKREIFIGKKEFTNPKGNIYTRFFRSGKRINDNTGCREDPDGYRILRKPNSGDINWAYKGEQSWCYRKWIRKKKREYIGK